MEKNMRNAHLESAAQKKMKDSNWRDAVDYATDQAMDDDEIRQHMKSRGIPEEDFDAFKYAKDNDVTWRDYDENPEWADKDNVDKYVPKKKEDLIKTRQSYAKQNADRERREAALKRFMKIPSSN